MAKNPVFPLYYNDIDRSTKDWSDEEFGAYMRLLMHQWDKGIIPNPYQNATKTLPNDFQRLSRIATSVEKNWPLLSTKFTMVDGGLQNKVLEDIRVKRLKHKQKQSENVQKRYQNATKTLPKRYQNATKKLPLEEEDENENINNTIHKDSTGGLPLVGAEKVKEVANKVWKDQLWKEQVCPGLSISAAALKKWMSLFNASVADDPIADFTESRYKRMIRGWIAKQQAKGVNVDDGLQKTSSAPPLRKL